MVVLTAGTLRNVQHVVSSTHTGFPALCKGILCHAAQMGRFLEDKCEPASFLSTGRARPCLNSTGCARQHDQSTSNFSPQYRMFFYHTGTKIQSYGLFWRDGFFLPHCDEITVLCCFAEACPSLGTAGEQRKSRTCPRMGHLLNLDQTHFMQC